METTASPTYMILGGDGNHYGPVTAEQFLSWVQEGRVDGDTKVMRTGTPSWVAASSLPELGAAKPVAAAAPGPIHVSTTAPGPSSNAELEHRLRSGASWFYWIAALSLINSILIMTGQGWGFAIGLGITREFDHSLPPAMAFVFSLCASGLVAMFGFFAIKRHMWAFIIGMILLALDTVLTVLQQAWISVAFHAWALGSIFMAFRACRQLRRI